MEGSKEEKSARDRISTRTLLNDGKSDKDPSQNMEQSLTTNIPNGGPTVIKGSTLANVANENSNEESLKSDTEMECISNFDEDILGKKELSLRSWKCILRSSNSQISLENLSKFQPSGKCSSSSSLSLDPSHTKKQTIRSDSFSVS